VVTSSAALCTEHWAAAYLPDNTHAPDVSVGRSRALPRGCPAGLSPRRLRISLLEEVLLRLMGCSGRARFNRSCEVVCRPARPARRGRSHRTPRHGRAPRTRHNARRTHAWIWLDPGSGWIRVPALRAPVLAALRKFPACGELFWRRIVWQAVTWLLRRGYTVPTSYGHRYLVGTPAVAAYSPRRRVAVR
jgi:hypothetical protein